ncbi:LytTR family transcriptional regulator [Lactiplantibacillus paraplantarum]|nr:LytTR family transcriptional regulator [Lactiplantibacillus paraplantarum]
MVRIAGIKNFTLTKWGSFQVNLTTGTVTYASRRYTQQIRKAAQL